VRSGFLNNYSDLQMSVIVPVIYSPQMSELTPPRSLRATVAAILAIVTGCYLVAISGSFLVWGFGHLYRHTTFLRMLVIVFTEVFIICTGVATVIAGVGVWKRRNRARVFAIALAGLSILFGLWLLEPFLRLPASVIRAENIAPFVLPVLAAIAWLALLMGKRVRAEFLPPVVVQIYVKLVGEGEAGTRPRQAFDLGNGLFELLAAEGFDPAVENWEFRPGSIVRGVKTHCAGETCLLATLFEA
jgi:lysylphosphatidylglycerol synthetase-like protein (DUF2156 family)